MSTSIRITGELGSDAELRYTPGPKPRALLFFQLGASKGFPFTGVQDYGDDPNRFFAAEAKQRLLRRGMTVTVHAEGLSPRTDHGNAVLRLENVTDVIPNIHDPREPKHAE